MGESDRRAVRRYPIALQVELQSGSAVTRDVSASGIFFEADPSFNPGGLLRFALVLQHADPEGPLRLECEGKIVRVELRDRTVGVAATLTRFWMSPAEPGRTADERPESVGEAFEKLEKRESPW